MTTRKTNTKCRRSFWGGILTASLVAIIIAMISLFLGSGEKNDITPFTPELEESLEKCLTDLSAGEECVIEYTFNAPAKKASSYEVLRYTK